MHWTCAVVTAPGLWSFSFASPFFAGIQVQDRFTWCHHFRPTDMRDVTSKLGSPAPSSNLIQQYKHKNLVAIMLLLTSYFKENGECCFYLTIQTNCYLLILLVQQWHSFYQVEVHRWAQPHLSMTVSDTAQHQQVVQQVIYTLLYLSSHTHRWVVTLSMTVTQPNTSRLYNRWSTPSCTCHHTHIGEYSHTVHGCWWPSPAPAGCTTGDLHPPVPVITHT